MRGNELCRFSPKLEARPTSEIDPLMIFLCVEFASEWKELLIVDACFEIANRVIFG